MVGREVAHTFDSVSGHPREGDELEAALAEAQTKEKIPKQEHNLPGSSRLRCPKIQTHIMCISQNSGCLAPEALGKVEASKNWDEDEGEADDARSAETEWSWKEGGT